MIESMDFKQLNKLTAQVKAQSESSSDFTISFLDCLMTRYNLQSCLMANIVLEEIPDDIIQILREGNIPTKEDLLPLDFETQQTLMMEMMWFAGMNKIVYYTAGEKVDAETPSTSECILAMRDVSNAHFYASYLFAGLTLLMNVVPSYEFVSALTNNFDNSLENLAFIMDRSCEVLSSLHERHTEDLDFFFQLQDDEDII
jgi:hypothetical protein